MAERPSPGFLGSLTPEEHRAFLRLGRRRRFRGGAILFREGDRSSGLLAIISGRAKVSSFTDEGKEVVVTIRGTGELLGEDFAIDGEPRSASGTALGPVEALEVGIEPFTEFLQDYPRVGLVLLRMVNRRLRGATRWHIVHRSHDITARIAARQSNRRRRRSGAPAMGRLEPPATTPTVRSSWPTRRPSAPGLTRNPGRLSVSGTPRL
jgi:CRP-like cAMP-binding protein